MSAKRPTWGTFLATVGAGVRAHRNRSSLRADELAEVAGVGVNTVLRLERGDTCTMASLGCVMDALGVEPPVLLISATEAENHRLRNMLRLSRTHARKLQTEVNRLERLRRGHS